MQGTFTYIDILTNKLIFIRTIYFVDLKRKSLNDEVCKTNF